MKQANNTKRPDTAIRRDLAEVRLRQLEYAAQARQVALIVLLRGLRRVLARPLQAVARSPRARGAGQAGTPARPPRACCP